jgi:hypothetical protein
MNTPTEETARVHRIVADTDTLRSVMLPGVEGIDLENWNRLSWSQKLRWPFPADLVTYRPQPWCKACNDAPGRVCGPHKKQWCDTCRQNLTEAHADLAYIGHADVTERLDLVDPEWSWKPRSTQIPDDMLDGLTRHGDMQTMERLVSAYPPKYDNDGGMWIEMTIHNDDGEQVTRIGYGDAPGKRGSSAIKEIIGDAIRNAAMRYGVARYLWSRSDIALAKAGRPTTSKQKGAPRPAVKAARATVAESAPPSGGVSPAQVLAQTAFEYAQNGSGKNIEDLRKDCHDTAKAQGLLTQRVRSPFGGQGEVQLSAVILMAKGAMSRGGGDG